MKGKDMSKALILLALAAISAAVFPSMAAAAEEDIPLHVTPKPTAVSTIAGGVATFQAVGGTKISCKEFNGAVTWQSATTGNIKIAFKNECSESLFGTECTNIETTELQFHLVTVPTAKPGILITPAAESHIATFWCFGGFVKVVVKGNGVVGTITAPVCGGESVTAKIRFEQASGVQQHKKVVSNGGTGVTSTEYHRESSFNGGEFQQAGQTGEATITFPEGKKKLECT